MRLNNRNCKAGSTGFFETDAVAPQKIKDQPMLNTPTPTRSTWNITIHTAAI